MFDLNASSDQVSYDFEPINGKLIDIKAPKTPDVEWSDFSDSSDIYSDEEFSD